VIKKKILETTSARALENKWTPQMLVILLLDLDGYIIIDTSVLLADVLLVDVSDFAVGFFGRDLEFAFLGFFKITLSDLYTFMSIVLNLKNIGLVFYYCLNCSHSA
jgi:hypothetical protein